MNQTDPFMMTSTTTEIPGMATVMGYAGAAEGPVDLACGPKEICLFCLKQGSLNLHTSFIPHPLRLTAGEAIFLAFPKGEWNTKILAEANAEFYITRMSISALHQLIAPSFDQHQLETAEKINMKDLMKLIPVNPSLMVCFDQLLHHKLQPPFQAIFERAKLMEIFSLLLETAFGQKMDACPVMLSPAIENKIRQVRKHIMEHIDTTPDPDHLAMVFELPRSTLKEGYKYMFGKTIHQFHADHKLESAMQMLESGEMLVKEIAFKIGYQNPSHFIAAFKKKYGYTPKQYLKREA